MTIPERLRAEAQTLLDLADELERTEKKPKTGRKKSVVLPEISPEHQENIDRIARKLGYRG